MGSYAWLPSLLELSLFFMLLFNSNNSMFVELYNFQSIFLLIFHLTITRNFSVVVGIRAQCSALWHIDVNQEMLGKWLTWIWHPDVSCNLLLIHGVVIISGIFLMEFIFCSSPFHLSCHSIWSYSSISMFSIFLCFLFFINTWDLSSVRLI